MKKDFAIKNTKYLKHTHTHSSELNNAFSLIIIAFT